MDNRYSVHENQLLYALIVALLANKYGDAMNDSAVKNCLESIEQHCLIGPVSIAFDSAFCQFTGYLYQMQGGKRHTVGTLRINAMGRARAFRMGPASGHIIHTTDRTEQYIERKELLRGIHRIDIRGSVSC